MILAIASFYHSLKMYKKYKMKYEDTEWGLLVLLVVIGFYLSETFFHFLHLIKYSYDGYGIPFLEGFASI